MRTRLAILACAATAIAFGFIFRWGSAVLAGAVVHALVGLCDLFRIYRVAKLIRADKCPPEISTPERVGKWIDGAITLTGLGLAVASESRPTDEYTMAGWIIWGGAIVCWLLSGIIVREVGGVPLSMGYGGWAIRRGRNGRILR